MLRRHEVESTPKRYKRACPDEFAGSGVSPSGGRSIPLTPLLVGLDQLLPWIHQWHPEIDPEFGETAGQSFQTMLEHDAHELGLTLQDIRQWTPLERQRKTRTTRKKKAAAEEPEDE